MKVEIYADGACRMNGSPDAIAGWAFCVLKDNELIYKKSGKIVPGTNNMGELSAILHALRYLKDSEINQATLYSDSSYCVKGILEWRFNWKKYNWYRDKQQTKELKNRCLWQAIDRALEDVDIDFILVKGHSNIKWHDYVDNMAKEETR